MLRYPLTLTAPEVVLWILQAALIVVLFRKTRRVEPTSAVQVMTVLFVMSLAWNWRLVYEFAIGSSGFWFFVEDDVARFLMSADWKNHPYFLTWDGIWQGGTFYLHGLAMKVVRDSMVASKLVSATYSLLSLIGVYLFTQGLFRNRRLSLAVVLVTAPLWFHLLISTGTMTEMPTTGLMMAGAGLLLMSASPDTHRRALLQWLAAASFFLGTAFHVTAWMMLVPILGVWFLWAIRMQKQDSRALARFFLCAVVSVSYIVAWLGVCWARFGTPFHMFKDYAKFVVRDAGGVYPLSVRLLAYPNAIAYTVWGLVPLAVFGAIYSCFAPAEYRNRIRTVVVTALVFFGILEYTAIRANPNPTTVRSIVVLSTMLIPFAVAALWPLVEENFFVGNRFRWTSAALLPAVLVGSLGFFWVWDNHQRTLRERRMGDPMDSNAIAVGAWLRQEIIHPQLLDLPPNGPPIRVWIPGPPWFRDINIAYGAGYPDRVEVINTPNPGYDTMQPSQYLVTSEDLSDPRMSLATTMGKYRVYCFHPGGSQ